MFVFVTVLIVLVCIFLILIILVQNPKGGLAENFTSSSQIFGAKSTSDIVERVTWGLSIAFFVLVFVANLFLSPTNKEDSENLESEIDIESVN